MLASSIEKAEAVRNIAVQGKRTTEPNLKNALLCKKAYIDDDGHNVYEGEFRTLAMAETPAVIEEIFVVTKWGDGAGREFKQVIKIFEPAGSLEIFSSKELESAFHLNNIYHEHLIIGRVTGLLLPREGRYRIEIYLNGALKGKAYFNVALRKTKEPAVAELREPEMAPAGGHAFFPFPIPLAMPFRLPLYCFRPTRD